MVVTLTDAILMTGLCILALLATLALNTLAIEGLSEAYGSRPVTKLLIDVLLFFASVFLTFLVAVISAKSISTVWSLYLHLPIDRFGG